MFKYSQILLVLLFTIHCFAELSRSSRDTSSQIEEAFQEISHHSITKPDALFLLRRAKVSDRDNFYSFAVFLRRAFIQIEIDHLTDLFTNGPPSLSSAAQVVELKVNQRIDALKEQADSSKTMITDPFLQSLDVADFAQKLQERFPGIKQIFRLSTENILKSTGEKDYPAIVDKVFVNDLWNTEQIYRVFFELFNAYYASE
ncbi:unnamed protein product, partial [Mesorhabditis belari]|uniref:Uncharacterized protein n=1 Tax=Mesorhabditis belari TaxID=2138241 RepID=A0AAF3ETP6_9BILA